MIEYPEEKNQWRFFLPLEADPELTTGAGDVFSVSWLTSKTLKCVSEPQPGVLGPQVCEVGVWGV